MANNDPFDPVYEYNAPQYVDFTSQDHDDNPEEYFSKYLIITRPLPPEEYF